MPDQAEYLKQVNRLLIACTGYGAPISEVDSGLIRALVADPSCDSWHAAYRVVVGPPPRLRTLWSVLCYVDDQCPDHLGHEDFTTPDAYWVGYRPSPRTVVRALVLAVDFASI